MSQDSSPTEGDKYEIELTDRGDEGDLLGRVNDGFVVFVPEANNKRTLRVEITDVGTNLAWAKPVIDYSVPFFSYGIFREGQIAHQRISDYIDPQREVTGHSISGRLLYEDGIVMLENGTIGDSSSSIDGDLIYFREERAEEAYQSIEAAEPMSHYAWDQVDVDGTTANVLIQNPKYSVENPDEIILGRDPKKVLREYFQKSMKTVREDAPMRERTDHPDRGFFRLQRGYLLMWSVIERYISLKWAQLDDDSVKSKRERFAEQDYFFHDAINEELDSATHDVYREIYRTDDPENGRRLEQENPDKAINYFYLLRSNETHRGKGDPGADKALLERAFIDLYNIFAHILQKQYEELYLNKLSNGEPSI